MAVKNHSLDSKIIRSARKEFLEHGYSKASLHKIASNAGTTTGALYTRYKSKDELFLSLVEDAISDIKKSYEPFSKMYQEVKDKRDVDLFFQVIRKEREFYLDFIFKYYEQCVLMFCRSEGSSIENMAKRMLDNKARLTVEFLKFISNKDENFDGIEFIMKLRYDYFKRLIDSGCDKEKAISCMKTAEIFLEAGWRDLFKRILD